jgi:hypothetical protein
VTYIFWYGGSSKEKIIDVIRTIKKFIIFSMQKKYYLKIITHVRKMDNNKVFFKCQTNVWIELLIWVSGYLGEGRVEVGV